MDRTALGDYKNWLKVTAADVLSDVKKAGGWAEVFPDGLPLWAHRVRNYFNQEPVLLTRLDGDTSREMLHQVNRNLSKMVRERNIAALKAHPVFRNLPEVRSLPDPPPGTKPYAMTDDIGETFALSDYVYKDEHKRIWFQMSPGATIYHWGREPIAPAVEAFLQVGAQATVPVFKLVSPDGTGGSRETIIKNPPVRRLKLPMGQSIPAGTLAIGEVNKPQYVAHLIVVDAWHQGSYNYSETVEVGLRAHELRDVKTHKKYPYPGVYVNPENRFSALEARRFPEKGDTNERNPLANQK